MPLGPKTTPEIQKLASWLGKPPRSPLQTHGLNESDSEIIQMSDGSYLATTTDSISEEIALGLYNDPYLMGWMAAQASLSDLAAVGARPLGLLFSAVWAPQADEQFKSSVGLGLSTALKQAETFLLGGDQGSSAATVLSGVGIGICEKRPVNRIGIRPGDYLCLTGKTGNGPALSFRYLRGESNEVFPEAHYRPTARLNEGMMLSQVSSAMMDTSDGVLSTLNTLSVINGIGLDLEWNPETLDPIAVDYCQKRDIPLWLLWVGEHGDFELIVAIPQEKLYKAQTLCPGLKIIGRATNYPNFTSLKVKQDQFCAKQLSVCISECVNSEYLPTNLATNLANDRALSRKLEYLIDVFRKEGFP